MSFLKWSIAGAAALAMVAGSAAAENAPGVSDTEILIGNTMPYSGPASSYGTIGKSINAYFKMINEQGGINGRKIRFMSLDDGYSPPRTVEQVRKLIESEEVAFLFATLGTPTNSAIHQYVNQREIPHLFVATGASKWGDPEEYPWSMGWQPNYQAEGRIYAKYLLKNKPDAKIGILYQNDDYGKDYVKGLKDGLGDKAEDMIVAEQSYEVTAPTIDSQMVNIRSSGANVFYNVTTPKFAAQAIKKVAESPNWKPLHLLNSVSNSVGSVLEPAGFDASKGIISVQYLIDPTDPQFNDHPEKKAWSEWMEKYNKGADKTDIFNVFGYATAATMVQVLKQCGDDLSRENIMRQAASLKDFRAPMLLPGIKINTGPEDFYPIEQEQLIRFDGERWQHMGEIVSGETGSKAGH